VGGAGRLESAAAVLTVVAALVVLAYRLGSGQDAATAVEAAFAVLLIAVPAAVGLGTGLPRLVGTERVNRLGVLVGRGAFCAAREVRTAVLVGTGTLTRGELGVHAVHVVDGAPAADVLRLAGAVAQESARPVDRAVAAATPRLPGVSDFDPVADLGSRGVVAEVVGDPGAERVIAHAVLVGDAELLAAHDIDPPAVATAPGSTPVTVAWDGVARGVLEVGPAVSDARAAAVRELAGLGVRPVLVASEDAPVAEAVAERAGLAPDAVVAGVAARDLAALVGELGPGVAVIGDPGRHRPALDAADLAVRVGRAEPAIRPTLTVAHGDLATAVAAIRIARRTAAVARVNVIWSLACIAALLPVTAAGLVGPAFSAAATAAGAAVLAINGLRPQRGPATGG
jgi:Cu+-exporting ATPase